MSPAALIRLLAEVEHLIYVKEEAHPSAHHISAIVAEAGGHCQGRFRGCVVPLDDLGNATGCQRLYARRASRGHSCGHLSRISIWRRKHSARSFRSTPPLDQHGANPRPPPRQRSPRAPPASSKRAACARPAARKLDDEDHRELDAILAKLRPLFRTHQPAITEGVK